VNEIARAEVESTPHGKNDFAEGAKILLDIDLKIILLGRQNNFVRNLKNNEQCCKKFGYSNN